MTAPTTLPRTRPAVPDERRRWLVLAVLLTGTFMALLDVTIVNVALPTMAVDLPAGGSTLQLIAAGYTVSYAMLLITGARLGALLGRRRLFLGGLTGFVLASLACGLAPGAGVLVAARFVQGAAAAAMVPQIITVIQAEFVGPARARALSAYAAMIAAGSVTGQVLGGVLVSADLFGTGWRPVFLVNVPVGLTALVVARRLLPADRPAGGRRIDLAGLATATPAVLLIVLPLVLGHQQGWPAWTFVAIAAGLALAAVFVRIERRVADPLLDLTVLRSRGMAPGLATMGLSMMAYGGFLFSLVLYLQAGLHDTALRAGLTFTPAALGFGVASLWWRRLPARLHRALTAAGLMVGAVAFAGLALRLDAGRPADGAVLGLLALSGLGLGVGFGSLLGQSMVHVPTAHATDASGLLTTTVQLAQVVGVAVFGSLYLTLTTHPDPAHAVGVTLGALAAVLGLAAVGGVVLARAGRSADQ